MIGSQSENLPNSYSQVESNVFLNLPQGVKLANIESITKLPLDLLITVCNHTS